MKFFIRPFMALAAAGLFVVAGATAAQAAPVGQSGNPGWSRANFASPYIQRQPAIVPQQPTIIQSTTGKGPIGADWWRTYPWSPYNAWQNRYWYPPYNKNYPYPPNEAYPTPRPYPMPSPWGIGSGNP